MRPNIPLPGLFLRLLCGWLLAVRAEVPAMLALAQLYSGSGILIFLGRPNFRSSSFKSSLIRIFVGSSADDTIFSKRLHRLGKSRRSSSFSRVLRHPLGWRLLWSPVAGFILCPFVNNFMFCRALFGALVGTRLPSWTIFVMFFLLPFFIFCVC